MINPLSNCPSQAQDILKGLETAVVNDIQAEYGKDNPTTELWDTAMEQVLHWNEFVKWISSLNSP